MSDEPNENPYAVSTDLPLVAPPAKESWYDRQTYLVRSVICWSAVCIISAIPSFVMGFNSIATKQTFAMLLGIITFIAIYVYADTMTKDSSFRGEGKVLSLTLRVVYIIRITISVLFPVALSLDTIAGFCSIGSYGWITGRYESQLDFIDIYAITLIQGVYLNLVLVALGLPILGVITLVRSNK